MAGGYRAVRNFRPGYLCSLALVLWSAGPQADTHPKVQAALDWQMPVNECAQPEPPENLASVPALSGTVRHRATNTTAETFGAPVVDDADPMEIARYERRRRAWQRCVSRYKAGLLEQFEVLRSSAQYGLTRAQAESIAAKLAEIQAAIISPDGVPAESRDEPE